MSVALFVAFIEVGLLCVFPYITLDFMNKDLFSIPEYLSFFFSFDAAEIQDMFRGEIGCSESAAKALVYLPVIMFIVVLLGALISLFLALGKKAKAAGWLQTISGSISLIMNVVLSFSLCHGTKSIYFPVNEFVNTEYMILNVLMIAFGVLSIVNPEASIGSKAAYSAPGMMAPPVQRNAYPQVTPAPVRQNVYTPPAAPAAPPAPAAPAAQQPAAASLPSISATYTCPVCGTTQKSELGFCTFCGNPNPNK